MTNEEYYSLLRTHYSASNVSADNKASIISDLQSNMQENLDNNFVSEYEIKIGMTEFRRTAKVNYTKEIVVAIKDERFKEQIYDALALSIYTAPNECDSGDYITMTIRDTEDVYLVRAEPNKKKNHDKLMLLQCQYNVKILDDNGITVHDYPMFFQDNKSRPQLSNRSETGITENSTFQAYVRHDAISRRFIDTTNGKSNKISRILIDGLAYEIAGSDPVTAKGIITLGLELGNKTPNDNLELGIADYWNNIAPTPPTDLITGDADLWIGDTNTYNIATSNTVTWSLTDNTITATLGLTGVNGECTVTCANSTALIGKTVTLTATLDTGTKYTKTIIITSRI